MNTVPPEPAEQPEPLLRFELSAERDYTPEQQVALMGLAKLLATVIRRNLERERPDLFKPAERPR